MRIARATVFLVNIPLRVTVEHALAFRTANTTGFLVQASADGTSGIGEFLAREYVTGETLEDCVAVLRQIGGRLAGAAVADPVGVIRGLWMETPPGPGRLGALGAADMALFDLCGKTSGRSVPSLLNRAPRASADDLTFSATYPLARGIKLAALHAVYRTWLRMDEVKVKGTGDLSTDRSYVAAIRRAFPYPINLRVDLNGSLCPEAAEEYFAALGWAYPGGRI